MIERSERGVKEEQDRALDRSTHLLICGRGRGIRLFTVRWLAGGPRGSVYPRPQPKSRDALARERAKRPK